MSVDLHTHSTYSDGATSLEENLAAALRRGVTHLGCSDHVRAGTAWLPEYTDHVARLRRTAPIRVWCGVETKMLDTSGRLDIPEDLFGVDYVAIADHQVPGEHGPEHPSLVAAGIAAGDRAATDVAEQVVRATVGAAQHSPRLPLVAHLFSVLPKAGVDERWLPSGLLRTLAAGLASAGAWVEVNEKWRCPSPAVVRVLRAHDVPLVAGSDAHTAGEVGRFCWVGTRYPDVATATAAVRAHR